MVAVTSNSNETAVHDSKELDRLELEAALSAACVSNDSSSSARAAEQDIVQLDDGTRQVSYDKNTELFQALEQCEWQKAFELSTKEALMTWVKSTGTTNTTFGWAIWRRLPIHEAIRRQAPAWLLVKMLSLYPESAWQTTQFHELPLHLAVEMGSTPEVLHLLLIAYVEGTMCKDDSGRTPLDVAKENEYPDPIVLESLERATHNHERLVELYQTKLANLRQEHSTTMEETQKRHQRALEEEWEKQRLLELQLKEEQDVCATMKKLGEDSKKKADQKSLETNQWKATVKQLQQEIQERQIQKEQQEVVEQALREELENRDATIVGLLHRIDVLEKDLSNSLVFHRDTVIKSMKAANEELQRMMASQQALQGHLTGQVQGLEMLLEKRGIAVPPLPPKPKKEPAPPEVDTSAAIHAATKALEVSNAKQGYV